MTAPAPAVSYIHVPGCGCAVGSATYAHRLREARRAFIAEAILRRTEQALRWYVDRAEGRLRDALAGECHPALRAVGVVVLAGGIPSDAEDGALARELSMWTSTPGAPIWCAACIVASARGWGDGNFDAGYLATIVRLYAAQMGCAGFGPMGDLSDAHLRIPTGSCLAWLDDAHRGQGWPGHRRDYRLLSLHRLVLATRASAAKATAARTTRNHECGSFERRHENVMESARERAQELLVAVLAAAPWGAQPDGSFLTRQSRWIASSERVHTLHAPGKGGPLAVVCDHEHGGGSYLHALRTREEARAVREQERAANRAAQERYHALLAEVDAGLLAGKAYRYTPGQEWGTLCVREPSRVGWPDVDHSAYVAALPALRRAGVADPEGALSAVMARIDEQETRRRAAGDYSGGPDMLVELDPESLSADVRADLAADGTRPWLGSAMWSEMRAWRTSLRAMPARVRRLPASQRARVAV